MYRRTGGVRYNIPVTLSGINESILEDGTRMEQRIIFKEEANIEVETILCTRRKKDTAEGR